MARPVQAQDQELDELEERLSELSDWTPFQLATVDEVKFWQQILDLVGTRLLLSDQGHYRSHELFARFMYLLDGIAKLFDELDTALNDRFLQDVEFPVREDAIELAIEMIGFRRQAAARGKPERRPPRGIEWTVEHHYAHFMAGVVLKADLWPYEQIVLHRYRYLAFAFTLGWFLRQYMQRVRRRGRNMAARHAMRRVAHRAPGNAGAGSDSAGDDEADDASTATGSTDDGQAGELQGIEAATGIWFLRDWFIRLRI